MWRRYRPCAGECRGIEGGFLVVDREDLTRTGFDRGRVAQVVVAVVIAQHDFAGHIPSDAVIAERGPFAERSAAITVGAEGASIPQHGEMRRKTQQRGAERFGPREPVVIRIAFPEMEILPAVIILDGGITQHQQNATGGQLHHMRLADAVGGGRGIGHDRDARPWALGIAGGVNADLTLVRAITRDQECAVLQGDAAMHAVRSAGRRRPGVAMVRGHNHPAAMAV